MEVKVQCLYCGFTTTLNVYSTTLIEDRRCDKCTDKRKKITKTEKKVCYYDDEDKRG